MKLLPFAPVLLLAVSISPAFSQHKVVLWADFFGNVGGGYPTPRLDQQVTLIHEFLHSFYNFTAEDHSDIVTKFKVGVHPAESDSQAVDRWIKNDCKN